MRYPEFLKNNLGFIAPSFGAVIEPYHTLFNYALDAFGEKGINSVPGPNCYAGEGYGKSSTAEKCAAEINEFFARSDIDAIISCGGGETMCEDLSFVDFDAIKSAPAKWFMGYSDNTNLILTLPTICDTAAIYGPCASSFGQEPWHASLYDAFDLITGKKLTFHNYDFWELREDENAGVRDSYNATEPFSMKTYNVKGEFEGRLLGGCIDCLSVLCGTPFDKVREFNERYKEDGTLWFLESCDLSAMSFRRALWQLKSAGWFETAKGFIFGRPLHFGEDFMGKGFIDNALDILGDMKLPMVFDVDIGHLPPMIPVIAGAIGKVTAENNSFSIKYELK